MKTIDKKVVIEQIEEENVLIYYMKPTDALFKWMEEQAKAIDNPFFSASASTYSDSGDFDKFKYLSVDRLLKAEDDTFSQDILGYSDSVVPPPNYVKDDYGITHEMKQTDFREYDSPLEVIQTCLTGDYAGVPFKIDIPKTGESHFFIPCEHNYGGIVTNQYKKMPVLRVTNEMYLALLLRCNKISLFLKRANEFNIDPITILSRYSFDEKKEIDVEELIRAENVVQAATMGIYGCTSFYDIPYDREWTGELLERPVSSDILEQAKIDEPIIGMVKSLAYPKNK